MKKRLRKKKRMGEFREWGCLVEVLLFSSADLDQFLDMFVQRVEEIGCYCGGGGRGERLSMVVELGKGDREPLSLRENLMEWVRSSPLVRASSYSELFDLWHGSEPAPPPII